MIKKLKCVYASVLKRMTAHNEPTNKDCPDNREIFISKFKEFDLRFYDFGL